MIGMVAYCYAALGGGPKADMFASLFQNGAIGWFALFFLIMGVGMWFVGNFALLNEADRTKNERGKPEAR